ncbi:MULTISPECIES: hypothetical protein, partial [unclassified Microcoleus]|uniref:hypothetical protein n=1 Tax=unclassified Microcoleus TaxID=2642155 RepID=UPI002FD5F19B
QIGSINPPDPTKNPLIDIAARCQLKSTIWQKNKGLVLCSQSCPSPNLLLLPGLAQTCDNSLNA